MSLDTINTILFWMLSYLLVWQIYILIFNKGVPNIRTAPAIRKKVIEILKKEMEASGKNSFTIIDLGSGNGLFTRQIARNLPQARVIGLETSRQQIWWANHMKRIFKLDNLEYRRVNFFEHDLSEADAIVMYLVIDLMEKIGKKLNQDLKKGTLVISNRFRLGDGWVPEEVIKVNTLYLHQRKLHIYHKS